MSVAELKDGSLAICLELPTPAQYRGERATVSGYGDKMPTRYKLIHCRGRDRRVYSTYYGNSAALFVIIDGQRVIVNSIGGK